MSGGCPGVCPSARVSCADTLGEIWMTSSGRALPVLVSMRVLTSKSEMFESALLRPCVATPPTAPTAVAALLLPPPLVPPSDPSADPVKSKLRIWSFVSGGSERNETFNFSAVPVASA